jgi:anti-anti-sigma regulatory factor
MDEMTIECSQDPGEPGRQRLKVCGRLTIGGASGLKDALLEALGAGEELQVDLRGVTQIDLSALQLLCAAHQSAGKGGKRFFIINDGNEVFSSTVSDAGFRRQVGCSHDTSLSCIWVGGGN